VGGFGPARGGAAALAGAWEADAHFDDMDAALAAGANRDVVSICAPNYVPAPRLGRIAAGPPQLVLAEKPVATDGAEVRLSLEACHAIGILVPVNYLRRWSPALRGLAAEIQSGAFGAIQSIVIRYAKGLTHSGSHMLDLAAMLVGPLSYEASLGQVEDGRTDDPTVSAMLRTGSGAPVALLGHDYRNFTLYEIALTFETAAIDIEESGATIRRRAPTVDPLYPTQRALGAGQSTHETPELWMTEAVQNISDALTAGADLACTGAVGLQALAQCESILGAGGRA